MLRPIEIENSLILVLEWVLVLSIRTGCATPCLSQLQLTTVTRLLKSTPSETLNPH